LSILDARLLACRAHYMEKLPGPLPMVILNERGANDLA